jgi:hypothetical protein
MKTKTILNYCDNGKKIYLSNESKIRSLYVDKIPNHTLIINILNSFHPNFTNFYELYSLVTSINEYKSSHGDFKNILIDFDETVVNPNGIDELEIVVGKPCYYINFDIDTDSDNRHISYPHSLYTHLDYLIEDGFIDAQKFLKNIILNYKPILKPHKFIFFSNNINLVRIKIFNILKENNLLKDNIWSFNNSVQYYSNIGIDLPKFLEENVGLIPHSYDKFHDLKTDLSDLRVSLIPNYSTYFEILTESFYYKAIMDIQNYTPCTEKMFKPIFGYQPFIIFASPKLKTTLEKLGMTFKSDLYGFYDITSNTDIDRGLLQIKEQISISKKDLHTEYYKNVEEYMNNSDVFLNFLINNKNKLKNKLL